MALELLPPPEDDDPDYTPAPIEGAEGERGWEQYVTSGKRGVHPTGPNAAAILSHDVAWRDVLVWDQMEQRPVWRLPRPPIEGWPVVDAGTNLADEHADAVCHWLYRVAGITLARSVVIQAMHSCALAHPWSPVAEYIERLTWDGVPRVGDWLVRYAGAAPTPYHGRVGAWWLRQAVARALEPGCQADYTLALEGAQGARKTTLLRVLGGRWYREVTLDLSDRREAAMALRGAWLAELAELAAIRRSMQEASKSYLTATRDRYRPPYGICDVDHPRRCVFAATTNSHTYLSDPSGARRWWPVSCGAIDIEAVVRDRDQLWAEAVVEYRAGLQRWPAQEDAGELDAATDERQEVDPWERAMARLMATRGEVSLSDCLDALEIRVQDQDQRAASRIRAIAQRLGWQRDANPRRRDGQRQRLWTPGTAPSEPCAASVPCAVPAQVDVFSDLFQPGTADTVYT